VPPSDSHPAGVRPTPDAWFVAAATVRHMNLRPLELLIIAVIVIVPVVVTVVALRRRR